MFCAYSFYYNITIFINLIDTFSISPGLLDIETTRTSFDVQRSTLSVQMPGTNESIDTNRDSFEMISEPNKAKNNSHSQAYVMDHSRQSNALQ